MGFLDTLKSAWKSVKNWWTGEDEKVSTTNQQEVDTTPTAQPQTLNEVANTINNQPQQIVNADPLGSFNDKVQAQHDADLVTNQDMPDPQQVGFLSGQSNVLEGDVKKALDEEKKDNKKSWIERFGESLYSGIEWLGDAVNGLNASSDYDANKKDMAMYYDKDSGDVYYLDINTSRGLADWDTGAYDGAQVLFDKAKAEYQQEINQAATQEDELNALQNFYSKTKDLFRLRADDYYSDGFFFPGKEGATIGRRKDNYSQDTLDRLAANNIDTSKKYVPSFEEFVQYLNNMADNDRIKQDIYNSYGLTQEEDNTSIDLSQSATEVWKTGFYDKAMNGVLDTAKTYLNEQSVSEAVLNSADAVTSQSNRIYNIVAEVYKKEQLVLAKPESQRDEADKEILDTANKLRQMEEVYASDLGNVIRQNIKYGSDSSGELANNIDVFEGGISLNQALTDNIKRIAGGEWTSRQSAIDVFQEVANKALYDYNKANKGIWAHLQRAGDIAGTNLSELGQQATYTLMAIRNVAGDVLTLDGQALEDKFSGRAPFSTTANYADNDFTIGRLLQTDMGNNTRTIYKYYLQGLEYVPEAVGNIAPDIAITAATGPAGLGYSTVKWGTRVNDAIKGARAMGWVSKLSRAAEYSKVARSTLSGLERVTALTKAASEVNPTIRIGAQLLDAGITHGFIDQAIDAQWSQFDTEPYSNTSMILSLTGTGLGEIFPLIWKSGVIQKMFNQSGIFDIVEYAKNNADGLANIARAMNTPASELTYQDLRNYLRNFDEISNAAKKVYNQLSNEGKVAADKWAKETLYNYMNQFFDIDNQSSIAKNMRSLVTNGSTNPADLVKYLGKIAGVVEFGPYVSTIQLKNGTKAAVMGDYDKALDTIDGGFASKISGGFTQGDLDRISKLENYSNILENKDRWFREVDGKYYLSNEGLEHFKLSAENQGLASLGIELAEAENVREIFKEKMKSIRTSDKAITDDTVDAIADSGAYTDVVDKVREIVC